MIHPLFITMAKRPGLFLEHGNAYVELAVAELGSWRHRLKRRATLTVAAVFFALLGMGVAGMAILLAAALPVSSMPMPWVLWALPTTLLLLASYLAWCVGQLDDGATFITLREQMAQDLATLKILDEEA